MAIFIRFIFGAALGSFINVLAKRYEPGRRIFDFKIIGGRSHCPKCGKQLSWYELIPILSFIFQFGRCRGCRLPISFQYPLVEIASGLVLAFTPHAILSAFHSALYRLDGALPLWHYLITVIITLAALTLILLAAIDFRLKIIPDQASILIAILGLVFIIILWMNEIFLRGDGSFLEHYAQVFGIMGSLWLNRIFAAVVGAGFLGALFVFSKGRGMGLGDVKLSGALGLLLGWPDIVLALFLAFISGSFWSIILMIFKRKKLKSTVPFGPFIALGALLVIFLGRKIMDLYFNMF